jgi:hypothetical protein
LFDLDLERFGPIEVGPARHAQPAKQESGNCRQIADAAKGGWQ